MTVASPFIDANENGVYDAATNVSDEERYIDVNGNGKYDGPNGVWDGDTMIWTSIRVLFTDDTVNILLSPTPPYTIPAGGSVNVSMSLADGNGNPLLPGTKSP